MKRYAEYRDSGIDWIGDIPKDWRTGKVGWYFQIQLGKMLQPEKKSIEDTLEQYLCAMNIGKGGLRLDIIKEMWFSQQEKETYALRRGDLLVVEGGDVGLSAIYNGFPENCYIQNALHRVQNNNKAITTFLMFWLSFLKQIGYIDLICNRATIAHFTKDKFVNSPMCLPPLDETQIEKLQEYRQSIISEAVTGKVAI